MKCGGSLIYTTKWEIGLFFTSCFSFIMTSMLIFKFCFLLAWIYLTFLTLFAPIALSKKFLHHITIAEYLKFGNFANFSQKPPSAISAFFNLLCCLSFIFFSVLFLSWLVFNPNVTVYSSFVSILYRSFSMSLFTFLHQ